MLAPNIYTRFVKTAVTFAVNSMMMGEGISGDCLFEAEERAVSMLTCQEAKIADAIKVT
jgi:hypothetical protein